MPDKASEQQTTQRGMRLRRWRVRARLESLRNILLGSAGKGGALSAVDQGIISLSNFVAVILLARFVNPTELGVYSVGFMLLLLARAIQQGLIVQPVAAIGAVMKSAEFRRYASSSGLMQLVLALCMAVVAAGVGHVLTVLGNTVLGPAVFSLWFAILFWQLQDYVRRLFYARGLIARAAVFSLGSNVVRFGALLWYARQGALSGVAGIYAIGWGAMVAIPLGLWLARTFWTLRGLRVVEYWKRNWAFGRWMLGGMLATWGGMKLYPILTAGMISFAQAGAYRAVQNLVAPVHVFIAALDPFLIPRAARRFRNAGTKGLSRLLKWTYVIFSLPILAFLLVATLFSRSLLGLLYGQTYLDYQGAVALMAVYYGLWSLYYPLQAALQAVQRTFPIFIANVTAIVSMFTIGLVLIGHWQVYGAIAGQALNALLVGVVLLAYWMKARHNLRNDD
ncbi:MAG: hypothetical protein PVF70_04185 [Anaerolineales bacterium]|jgi:O-antigen/teichoic acid export membrane protein